MNIEITKPKGSRVWKVQAGTKNPGFIKLNKTYGWYFSAYVSWTVRAPREEKRAVNEAAWDKVDTLNILRRLTS